MQNVPLGVFILASVALLATWLFWFMKKSAKNEQLVTTQQHRRVAALLATPFALSSSALALTNGYHEASWLSALMYVVSTAAIVAMVWMWTSNIVRPANLYSHIGGGNVFSSIKSVRAFHPGPVDLYLHDANTGKLVLYRLPALDTDEVPTQLVFSQIVAVDQQTSVTK